MQTVPSRPHPLHLINNYLSGNNIAFNKRITIITSLPSYYYRSGKIVVHNYNMIGT